MSLRDQHLRPFDVPAVGTGRVDADRLLVGRPDPSIGPVVRAWSSVSARPRKKELNTGPGCGIGVVTFLIGGAVGTQIASSALVAGACAVGLGLVGFFLGGQLSFGGPEEVSWYIGALGLQRNELTSRGVVSQVYGFDQVHLLDERLRRFGERGPVDSRLDLLPRAPGQSTTFLPPMITADLPEHILEARLRSLDPRAPLDFPVITRPLDATPSWRPERTGSIRLLPDALELTFGGRTERVALSALTVRLSKGRALFQWPGGGRAETEIRNVGDGSLLLALLAQRGRLLEEEA